MRKDQVNQEVKTTQAVLDKLVPGKVKVKAEYDDERRCYILIGEYLSYMALGEKHKTATLVQSTWTESMDKFYKDNSLFVGFFKQRAKYMNASKEEQIAFNGHPAMFGME
jgi:hypothetical protein